MRSRTLVRPLALVLAAAVTLAGAPLPSFAAGSAILAGRVITPDGRTPRSGVVVALYDEGRDATYRSAATDARGAFRIDAAPAGTYALLVETDAGAFLAADRLRLDDGSPRTVSLALQPTLPAAQDPGQQPEAPSGETPPQPSPSPAPATTAAPPAAKPKLASWAKWLIVGGIVVGGALVIDAIASEDDASTF